MRFLVDQLSLAELIVGDLDIVEEALRGEASLSLANALPASAGYRFSEPHSDGTR